MLLSDILQKLETVGIPVAYRHFKTKTELPFVVYYSTGSRPMAADGENYYDIEGINIELYTKNKDIALESKVEKALDFCVWSKEEIYLEDEKCYMIAYRTEV